MKSAYELALERSGGGPLKELDPEQKDRIAELESYYKSKRVEAELSAQRRLDAAAGDLDRHRQIQEDLSVEIASLDSKLEKEKMKVRGEAE